MEPTGKGVSETEYSALKMYMNGTMAIPVGLFLVPAYAPERAVMRQKQANIPANENKNSFRRPARSTKLAPMMAAIQLEIDRPPLIPAV